MNDNHYEKESNSMSRSLGFLDAFAVKHGVFISDLRIDPHLRGKAMEQLSQQPVPDDRLQEWWRAMDYLAGKAA